MIFLFTVKFGASSYQFYFLKRFEFELMITKTKTILLVSFAMYYFCRFYDIEHNHLKIVLGKYC